MFASLALLTLGLTQVPARSPAEPALTNLRARLYAYEQRTTDTTRPDPAELSAIASAVIAQARQSTTFSVWSEACASTAIPESDDCSARLRAILNAPRQSMTMRANAASALMARGETAAAKTLAGLIGTASASSIAPLVSIIANMPAGDAVPLLVRLAASPAAPDQEKACEALSAFDVPESHAAVAKIVDANPPGTRPWLFCMIARARLHEAIPAGAVGGYGNTLQGHGQLFAAKVMLETGNDAGAQLLEDLTHRGDTRDRLQAAGWLVDVRPAVAIPVIDAAETNPDSGIRAEALALEQRLKRPPSKAVRLLLVDADGVVRVRAAEAVIDWAKETQKR